MTKILTYLLGLTFVLSSQLASSDESSPLLNTKSIFEKSKGFGPTDLLQSEDAFLFDYEVKNGSAHLRWSMPDGYYLYKDKFDFSINGSESIGDVEYLTESSGVSDDTFGDVEVFYHNAEVKLDIDPSYKGDLNLSVGYQGCAAGRLCYPPDTLTVDLFVDHSEVAPGLDKIATDGLFVEDGKETDNENPKEDQIKPVVSSSTALSFVDTLGSSGFFWTVALFFALGVGLTFTPCVLPMIPIISSLIVGGKNEIKRTRAFTLSLSYVGGMAVIYTGLGLLAGTMGAAWNLQAAVQTPLFLGVLATIFVMLALTMFDVYELRVPGFISRLGEKGGDRKSAVSIFVAGGLSAIAVSPCITAPLAGTLIYLSTTGDLMMSGAALLAMSLGMGLPLVLIGTFGRDVLPKTGSWMVSVKQLFGLILIGTAIWMISRVLSGSVSLFIWGVFGLGVAVYLFGVGKKLSKLSAVPLIMAMTVLLWSAFLIAGSASGKGEGTLLAPLAGFTSVSKPTDGVSFEVVTSQSELEKILGDGKPVMVDVYADWCISCAIMDRDVFSQPEVKGLERKFRFVKLDVTEFNADHKKYLDQHALVGPPAQVFYYANGDVIEEATLVGEVGLEQFMDHVRNQVMQFID